MTDRFSLAGHDVDRVGYGTMQLPGPGVFGPPADHDAAIAVLRRARELGVDHFDTSAYYGPWVSNALLREALHPYDGMTIVSKVGGRRGPDASWLPASTPPELQWGIDENLIGLGVERIDVMNLRLMGVGDAAFDEKLGAMADAVQAGKIGAIGLSNVGLAELDRAAELGVEVACVQNRYALTFREDEALLRACAERGIAFVPFFPLDFGRVTGHEVVARIAARLGVTPAQVGLAWLLAHAPNLLLIAGTSSIAHLEENVAVGQLELGAEDVAALDAVAA
ncbi:MAG: pyridoxine 4-dehydrogenase [Solirubrobacteraceae bacterium]|jgi:aryl-alcohol dehydrogenase-like predicted oxidoreductase|nr:pyridoxine 4-dehydrogenase [Solirubrobacteraceae bacterium]